jgi:heme-degrading monooxygenase HmoA
MSPEKTDEATDLYKEGVVPAAKSQKGFCGIYLLSNPKTGKAISISLWDNEADALANEQSGYYQEQLGKFKDFFTAPPVQEGYEVAVRELK